jgi:hypothetical protein
LDARFRRYSHFKFLGERKKERKKERRKTERKKERKKKFALTSTFSLMSH